MDAELWGERVRAHDHTVVVSLLALGLRPDRAREIAQATWLRLIEQDAAGALGTIELPGLAIRQARFLALDAIRRDAADRRRLADALEVDPASDEAIERRLAGRQELAHVRQVLARCDECLDEVGREARLELLLRAAGDEDAFAAVVEPPRRRRWPLAAGVAVAAAAAGAAFALWPSRSAPTRRMPAPAAVPTGQQSMTRPVWAAHIEPETARCSEHDGGLICSAASGFGTTRDQAEDDATDIAREALLELALLRGGEEIRAQRALYSEARSAALASPDREATRRTRHAVASRAQLGHRESWYWEEYNRLDGDGTEFLVFVRFTATADEIESLLAGYRTAATDGAELAPIVPGVRWALDPGDDLAWFVVRPGALAGLGVRAGDVLLHDPRRSANALRTMIARDQAEVWRPGLAAPVLPSKLR